ncbi:MAG: DUF6891 domain-containing protein [Gulosibacter sp.]|uniref:DUF6891 domain-containing protein n=1 Tax=Gulosibacter sp. TaxID=2817531 RepID=UPI003F93561E
MSLEKTLRNSDRPWFLDDVYQRILHGEIEEAYEAVELLEEHLEEEPDAEALAERVWAAALETASKWASDTTDTDRFYAALTQLEAVGIDAGIYTDFADVDDREGQRGALVLWVNTWENFDPEKSVPVMIPVAKRGPTGSTTEVATAVVRACIDAGLDAAIAEEDFVKVDLKWRHHVVPWDQAGGPSNTN